VAVNVVDLKFAKQIHGRFEVVHFQHFDWLTKRFGGELPRRVGLIHIHRNLL